MYQRKILFGKHNKNEKKNKLIGIKDLQIKSAKKFYDAGTSFEKSEMFRFAGSCYFTARAYKKAAVVYEKVNAYN